ncbi:hypothetical protein A8709_14250 [Paenibacillus pectinilyticus]|uniref:Fibronectin type-III domain-containing protein n=1 Tax=Paenibacillus pectinilyticus TaxID=512399 RepID=A0A1C1A3Z0_9BACL|nr:cadherin-like beta sandwich domain-containing protein [Paenibacillus pectinilyticus]OCT15256.1 hypothetical protein A8709_14250 [Paenibacillus pectinilyticus]
MRKRRKTGIAKLLIALLLVQYLPLLHTGLRVAQAAGEEPISAYRNSTVQLNTYAPSTKITDYQWNRVTTNISPGARQSASMVYDEKAEKVIMFGGQGNSGLFNETWIWDGTEQTWQEKLNLTNAPSKRKGAAMAYDAVSQKVLLFGGEGQSGVLGDTWLWDGLAAKWEQVTGLPDSPTARGGAQLAFDGEQLVLFGGYTGTGNSKTPQGDTWLWNGTAWTKVTPAQSPPAAYSGQMAYDGQTAVLYGGDSGPITKDYTSTSTNETKSITHDDSSPLLWKWDREAQSWISTSGPEAYGRWGQAMAYDGRRVVFFGGERDYVHEYNAVLVDNLKLPSSTYPPTRGSMAYSWTGSKWETAPLKFSTGTMYQSNLDKDGKAYEVQGVPNQVPFPLSYANMAFDGKNFVMFGGSRDQISIMDKVFGSVVGSEPAGNRNETWVYGYTPPSVPGVKFTVDPIYYFDPEFKNDTVSVITNVYNDGTKDITSRGVEYRTVSEENMYGDWVAVPYTTAVSEGETSFTVSLSGLKWHQQYEVRGYAVNAIGKGYTEITGVKLDDDKKNVHEPDVDYDRVGASVLHVKDKKRLVAVGTGISGLLRKPISGIHYYLQGSDGTQYPLNYNILSDRQLELTWKNELLPGKYDVHLEHDFFNDYVFTEGLLITALDFYKPRNFARVDVPSTSATNEVSSLGLQGPFTEDPSAPNVYTLNDTSEPVAINESVMFKGTSLIVDKSTAKTTISGNGRLYVNGGGALGANVSYTIHEGSFTLTSDNFAIPLNNTEATDYLNMDMPVKTSSLIFTKDGLRLTGDLEIGMQVGNQKVKETVSVDDLNYRNNRFDLTGTYQMLHSFKVGPINASDTKFVVDSRIPYVGVRGTGSLPNTNVSFDLNMKTKQGRLDSVNFGMYQKMKLASTGLQVNYLFGSVDKLAEKTQIPQTFSVTGSVNDVIVPELKHPQVNYKFNLIGTDSIDVDLSNYGFSASGIEYYYWLPVKNMNMQTVVNPTTAGIKGFSSPGFATKGDINLFEVVKGAIGTYSFNQKGFNGAIKGTVYVPKGIPRIGGATVNNVALSVNETGIYGTFKHNGVGANLKYTFNNNTILFEVEAEPPKKSWWEKGLDFMNSVSDFMDAAEPWLDIAEELFLKKDSGNEVRVAAANPLKRVFDLTPMSISFQPQEPVHTDAKARIVNGELTTLDQTLPVTMETKATSGEMEATFAVERPFRALIALTGDQRAAVLKATASGQNYEQTVRPEVTYDDVSQTTYMRVSLFAGKWHLTTAGNSLIQMSELLFANESLKLSELGQLWSKTPDRSVTSLTVKERGTYVIKIGQVQGDVIIYKPDGRPYNLQTIQTEPDWNAFRDVDGNLYALLDSVEAGTWMISAGTSPTAVLNSVPSKASIADIQQWGQDQAYPTVFDMTRTGNGQAIVEIYGANAQTKLYAPNGELYTLQANPNLPGMNVLFDESQQKKTILLDGSDLNGQWKVVSSSYTSVVAYKSTRKFKSIKPLTMEGRYGKYFDIKEQGDYLLTVIGGNADSLITAPDGSTYTLNFDAPDGNAYLQPASDRVASANPSGDPLKSTKIDTPYPVVDGKDTLYVSLLNVPAGKWKIQNASKVDLQIQKLLPQTAVKASVSSVVGAENHIQVTWSEENAAPDAQVTLMLTDSASQMIGEVIQTGLPASGSQVIEVPASILPGTYYLSVGSASAGKAPVYAIAEGQVEVTAPVALSAPKQPEVISTGNGEISLRFASITGDVTAYRIWVSESADGQAAVPLMDIVPQSGNIQDAIISGLTPGVTYQIAISAIGQEQGRIVLSPQSELVSTELPVPQPATLSMTLDAGGQPVTEQAYVAYYGNEEKLLLTAAEQASLQVTANQNATVTLFVNGKQLDSQQVSAGVTSGFALQDLLQAAVLKEREYSLLIEAVNERGDRSTAYRKLVIDRTGPMLIASGGPDAKGKPISLNGTVTEDSRVYITGQTDAGAKLVVNGITVPLDDKGKFTYYAPLEWGAQTDRLPVVMTATDQAGNETKYGFEVIRGLPGAIAATPSDLAALTVGNATMAVPYQFGTSAYQALALSENVRVYAVPMVASSVVTIDNKTLPASGYVDVAVPVTGKTVSIKVHSNSAGDKVYSLSLDGTGSNEAGLSTLLLNNSTTSQPGDVLPAQAFTGTEEKYTVYVDNSVESVTVTPGARKQGSNIQVKNQTVHSGQASDAITLQVGVNQVPVAVTSPDGSETRNYQLIVVREQSGDAQLQSLGLISAEAELVGDFSPTVRHYQVFVPYTATEIKLLPASEHTGATIRVNDQTVTSGAISLPFSKDAQTITIKVTAEDGTVLTYTLDALRKQILPVQPPMLASLQASTILDGAFSPYKLKYSTISTTTNSSISITALADDPNATVRVQGEVKKGGGTFNPSFGIGMNTIILNVESADQKTSQTYSIDVTRLQESQLNVRQTTIEGSTGGWTLQTSIERTKSTDGKSLDTVKLNAKDARTILEKASQNKDKVARIYVTDLPDDPADERIVSLNAESVGLLADGGMSMQIQLPDAQIVISAASLQQMGKDGKDAYFRIVPVRADAERSEVTSRVLSAELVLQAAEGDTVSIIGQPVRIETNYSGYKTEIVFPLNSLSLPKNGAAAKQVLDSLAVYIEHSDGEKALQQGEIRYDADGKPVGIAIEISKFSTFTIIQKNGAGALKPYISGYPDGTFRPTLAITRAELATILNRIGAVKAINESISSRSSGYSDVPKGHWAEEAILNMQRSGLMLGDDTGFRPDDAITRGEIASIAARLLSVSSTTNSSNVGYTDTQEHWAFEAIKQASQAGILQGYADGTFLPDNKLNRAEAVKVLNRLFNRSTVDVKSSSWPDVPQTHWALRDIESASGTVQVLSDGSVYVVPNH